MLCVRAMQRTIICVPRCMSIPLREHGILSSKDWKPRYNPKLQFLSLKLASAPPKVDFHKVAVLHVVRSYATESPKSENEDDKEQIMPDGFKSIYRYSNISALRNIYSLKIFQTGLIFVILPYLVTAYNSGAVSTLALSSGFGLVVLSTGLLFVISSFTQRIICVLKYNEATETVKISHMTFWGRRKETEINLSDIMPISDTTGNVKNAHVKLCTRDKKERFYLFLNMCSAEEKQELLKIFG